MSRTPRSNGDSGAPDTLKDTMDADVFLRTAGRFISVANRENRKIPATELHVAFLYASARYSAHVARKVQDIDDHEAFVMHMTRQYQEMLRQHLADDTLDA